MKTITIAGGFKVPSDTHLGAWQQQSGKLDHDEFLVPFVTSKLKEGMCVLDVGAFDGDHTIAYSSAVGGSGMVVAVEPGSIAFECLLHNVGLFPLKNVFPLQACVGEHCGQSAAHTPALNLGASVCWPMEKEKMIEGEKYLLTVNIDYLTQQCMRKVDFIKLDVEGWEVGALIGATKTLTDHRPQLLIEVNSSALLLQGEEPAAIFQILSHHGYTFQIVQPDCKIGDPQYDIWCKPKWRMGDPIDTQGNG